MGRSLTHFEILGTNTGQLRAFYAQLFDWTVGTPQAEDPQEYAMVSTHSGEPAISGGIGKALRGAPAVTFYVGVDDLASTLARVEALGGKTVMGPQQISATIAIALLADPEGNVIGLTQECG